MKASGLTKAVNYAVIAPAEMCIWTTGIFCVVVVTLNLLNYKINTCITALQLEPMHVVCVARSK